MAENQVVRGEALGHGEPDWPDDLQSFKERVAYQRGVADARRLAISKPDVRPTTIGKVPVNETGIDMMDKALTTTRKAMVDAIQDNERLRDEVRTLRGDLADAKLVRIGSGATVQVLADLDDVRQVIREELRDR